MAEAKDCPKCGLVNPPTAQRCDCGWDFVSGQQEESYLPPNQRIAIAAGLGGTLFCVFLYILIRVLGGLLRSSAN